MGARRRTIVGGHFLTMDDLADTTLDHHTVDERLTVIEREINTAVADLARTIDENYVMFVPQAFAESEAALRKTQKLLSDATFKLGAIEGAVQDMSEVPAENEDESVAQKLGVVKELKGRLDSLVHIEKDMSALWRLEATKEPLKVAEQITKIWKLLDEIVQEDGAADIFADRIHPALCDELVSRQSELAQFLDQYFRQRLTFASYEHVDPNKWTLKLSKDAESTWTECFTAMEVIGKLDPALTTFATTFCDRFCETVVNSAACANSFKHRQFNGTETFQITKPTKKDERPTPKLVFSKLTDIINYLSDGVGNTKIGQTLLITAIGDRLRDRLMDLIVRDCLTPAVPMEKNASFSDVLGEATGFHNVMVEIELFRNDCKSLKDFCENHSKIFLDRRCLKIMGDARTLISKPYIEMVEVGSNEDGRELHGVHEHEGQPKEGRSHETHQEFRRGSVPTEDVQVPEVQDQFLGLQAGQPHLRNLGGRRRGVQPRGARR
ncbi:hypothetical protein L596_025558 [Steinernema carpocapsae]|uniref:Centromere/kinetochore protein zw10 middle domain-containing protein n=1 Tax=Steinernema carpocapsae TaxID=34508 RepID=A0A4U5M860_STECR|nr:hypothetical protein L596_025558 [Steinernema carpocapsae]